MSRSLSRIRNLVSEIEEIHRQGQQGGKSALTRTASLKPEPATQVHGAQHTFIPPAAPFHMQNHGTVPQVAPVSQASVHPFTPPTPVATAPVTSAPEAADPFEALDKVVHLDERRDPFEDEAPREAKIYMQLSGAVALSLQIEDTGETVELKQVGDLLEIRFTDGKAFHIPLKTVA